MLYASFENTQAHHHRSQFESGLIDVYSVDKPSESLRFLPFEKKLHNKMLLWYPVLSPSCLAAILTEGIKLPDKDAAQTGYMFGKGIYFTDCFSKAAKMTLSMSKGQRGQRIKSFVILAEVALGDMHLACQPHQF